MAVFGNFKGTTQSDFKIGKTGVKIHGGISSPITNLSQGDIWLDGSNASISVYQGNAFVNIGATLTDLNVDDGTLFVDNVNDTVSIGSTTSNEKLFVNGSIRLGTNPAIKYSGAFLDVSHANGTGTVLRIRDNTGNTDPVFKVFSANNESEVFRVDGTTITVANSYVLPESDGSSGQVVVTDGNGTLSFGNVSVTPAGTNTQIQFNDTDSFGASDTLTFEKTTSTLQTGVVRGVLFEPITDYGFVTDTANMVISYGLTSENDTHHGNFGYILKTYGITHDQYTVESLPDPRVAGQMIYISNAQGGSVMAFSDGDNWRRVTDRDVVS